MAESFSNRHGYRSADAEITVHEDAPENLRYAIPLIGEEIGMSPSAMRRIICQVLLVPPDRNNWSEHPNIWEEAVGLVADCPRYKVYDIAEAFHATLAQGFNDNDRGCEAELAAQLEVDLSRFDAAPLIAFTATKETDYGTETDG